MTESRTVDRKGRKVVEQTSHKLSRLSIDYVPIDSIFPNDYNPNRQSEHDFELLLKSMEMDGFTQPILVLRDTRKIVDGEHRQRAARTLNERARNEGKPEPYLEIPVVFVDMDQAQAYLSTFRHNRARGSEDIELAAEILRDLEQLGAIKWAQDELLLSDIEVQRLLDDVSAPEALAAEEFSTAWVPEGTHHASEDGNERAIGGAPALEGITASASERQRAAERAVSEAKTDEERQAAMRDRDIFRIALTFDGEQAKVVRQVLGDRPADKLLEMCRIELGRLN